LLYFFVTPAQEQHVPAKLLLAETLVQAAEQAPVDVVPSSSRP
jgi:hypothetical protein